MPAKPIAIFYEHPEWFQPLFAELDSRKIDYERLHINEIGFDPADMASDYSLVVNRVSAFPSTSSDPRVVLYVKQYLAYLERIGVPVINGWQAYEVGASKALQMTIFKKLGLTTPASRVIHHADQSIEAARSLRFPVLIKPNVGGSGAGITLFNSLEELERAAFAGTIDLGIDNVALVQEYLKPKDDCIYRVEVMDDDFLYAIRLPIVGESFNYCPADGCNIENFDYCPLEGPSKDDGDSGRPGIAAFEPTADVIETVRQAVGAAGADIGGIEYLINAEDGTPYFYDINPLSNFVANAVDVVGFDPLPRFVDFILRQVNPQ